jgi:uridine kinase
MAHFAGWTEEFKGDPLREDAYTRAARVNAMLAEITPLTDDTAIPEDSVLREFIGGSVYKY